MSEQDGTQVPTKPRRSGQVSTQKTTLQRPANDDKEAWKAYWEKQGQPWRTEPEIDTERQKYLAERRSITPDIEQCIYPFKDIKLSRADVEWLLATHENSRGPVDWNDENQRGRKGLDLRGADLRNIDLSSLPLACVCGGLEWEEWRDSTKEQRHASILYLDGTDLTSTHLEGAILSRANLKQTKIGYAYMENVNLHGAHLEETFLYSAILQNAYIVEADLEKATLTYAHLEGADLGYAFLEGVDLYGAYLEGAFLYRSNLVGVRLCQAHLEGCFLKEAHLEKADLTGAHLEKADLTEAHLEGAILRGATLNDKKHIGPQLADAHWADVNLSVVRWLQMELLGDEYEARQKKHEGKTKDRDVRLKEYEQAVRANRQLAVVLRDQGLNEEADHFAYRAQLLQREVWRLQRRPLKFVLSWFLYLLAGYGYRPLRSIVIYLLVIASFAFGYYEVTHILHAQPYPLAWYEALILSVSSFHGRGFFQPVQSLGDPVAILASIEAVFGLLIEISFIATFTQRFFGK